MTLLAIPNVSEGRDRRRIQMLARTLRSSGLTVLDIHSDEIHNRSVFTASGAPESIVDAATALVHAASYIDLTQHTGVHPRLGGVDVFPVVPHEEPLENAVSTARAAAASVSSAAHLPVYLYAAASPRRPRLDLPDVRRGGLTALAQRAAADLPPDHGPPVIDPSRGVVCVGARGPLIAFNVTIGSDIDTARRIARTVRQRGGPRGIRVLAFAAGTGEDRAQISMNLTDPESAGIDAAYELVERAAKEISKSVLATEIIGLVPDRFLPAANGKAARLLIQPSRSVESALGR